MSIQWKKEEITAALFDIDGILFDTEKLHLKFWKKVAEEEGITLPPEFAPAMCGSSGKGSLEVIRRFYHTEDPQKIFDRKTAYYQETLSQEVPVKEGVPEILSFFQQKGIKIAVASSSPLDRVRLYLEKTGLTHFFAAACSGSDLEHGKPAPDIFLKAAAMLDAPPGECFVFEDSFNGIRAAHAGGMHPMMVVDLLEPDDEMRKISDGIFYSMNEVRKCLLQ